jgi:hypothetical protein
MLVERKNSITGALQRRSHSKSLIDVDVINLLGSQFHIPLSLSPPSSYNPSVILDPTPLKRFLPSKDHPKGSINQMPSIGRAGGGGGGGQYDSPLPFARGGTPSAPDSFFKGTRAEPGLQGNELPFQIEQLFM